MKTFIAILVSMFSVVVLHFSDGVKPQFGKSVAESIQGWVPFTSPEGRFGVHFPAPPELERKQMQLGQTGRSLEYSEYKSRASDTLVYMASYTYLPSRWRLASSSTLLKGALKVIMQNEGGMELVEERLASFQDHPALHFVLKRGTEEVYGTLILMGKTLYQLNISCFPEVDKEVNREMFVNSFKIL